MKDTKKASFVLYHSFGDPLELLSMEERGMLFTAIFEYERTGETSCQLSPAAGMAFAFIRETLDRNREDYIEKCAKNSENGKKGGRPRKEKTPMSECEIPEEETERFFEKPQKADNDNDNGNDNDNDNDNGNGGGNEVIAGVSDEPAITEYSVREIPPAVSDATAPLTEKEINFLKEKGLPSEYIEKRAERAAAYSSKYKKNICGVLIDWWHEDRKSRASPVSYTAPRASIPQSSTKSYDVDDFFRAALERSYGEMGISI